MPVICPHCSREFPGERVNSRHLAVCNPTASPTVPPCLCGHEATSLTQMKRHRKDCPVWQSRDAGLVAETRRRETSLGRYGVEDAAHRPEVQARRVATNQERYGASNPFCREASTFEAVQTALEGKRPVLKGVDNPFARLEVQEKIRGHWQREHGVSNPQQVPEVRGRTKATVTERYGGELLASPDIRAKAEATNLERYGAAFAGGTPEVQAKVVATNLAKYGVPHTCMDPEVRAKQMATMVGHYGSHFFASAEGQEIIRGSMLERYGVEFPGEMEGHWEKAVAAFRERFGVDHPLQLAHLQEKQRQTNQERYGWDYFMQSPEFVRICLEKAGVPIPVDLPAHPMLVREYAAIHLERMGRQGPNLLEQQVQKMCPSMLYTGDGGFWRWVPGLKQHKNPDFIQPGPDPDHPKRGVAKVVEVFGDYWHGRMKTGKVEFEHEQELIEAFQDIGITCLILWESEVNKHPQRVAERLRTFLTIP
ncbi:MAG: hypothetical protein A2Y38_19470 [Spirochaetes bacterium GWB1_59_5]|nr:MAG: hypothetical protein A2Y38_19470 [Spirochaetes bacterium GWB1_59_5]